MRTSRWSIATASRRTLERRLLFRHAAPAFVLYGVASTELAAAEGSIGLNRGMAELASGPSQRLLRSVMNHRLLASGPRELPPLSTTWRRHVAANLNRCCRERTQVTVRRKIAMPPTSAPRAVHSHACLRVGEGVRVVPECAAGAVATGARRPMPRRFVVLGAARRRWMPASGLLQSGTPATQSPWVCARFMGRQPPEHADGREFFREAIASGRPMQAFAEAARS